MLVLMRRPGETVELRLLEDLPKGTILRVTVVAIERARVRVGFEAPLTVAVDREEIADKKRLEQQGGETDGNVADHDPPRATVKGAKVRPSQGGNR